MTRTLLLATSVFLLAGAATAQQTIESRCQSDSTCAVQFHEPLNSGDGCPLANAAPGTGASRYNPSDTNSGQQIIWNGSSYTMCMAPTTGSSQSPKVALPGRDYVMRGSGAGSWSIDNLNNGNGKQRICLVHYEYLEGNWDVGNHPSCSDDLRHKLHTYNWSGDQWQITDPASSGCTTNSYGVNTTFDDVWNPYQRSQFNVSVSKATWVRMESCVYTDSSDLSTGQAIKAAFRITRVDNGQSHTVTMGEYGGDVPATANGPLTLAHHDFFRQRMSAIRYISTAAQLSYTQDRGQWPGPDCAIEPGAPECGGSPAPPPEPEPTAPLAPTLLPPDPSQTIAGTAQGVDEANGVRLEVSALVAGGTVDVQSAILNGVGPYNVLTDCGNDGSWNGVSNELTQPSASHACSFPTGTHDVGVRVWDQGTNVVLNVDLTVATP